MLDQERDWTSGTKRNYQKAVRLFLGTVEDDVPADRADISLANDQILNLHNSPVIGTFEMVNRSNLNKYLCS
jgi:hypothetical protein